MTHTTQRSTRLRADVALYASPDGHVLRIGGTHHHVHLAPNDADALLDALVAGGNPDAETPRAALESLVDAGLVDPLPVNRCIIGDGALAQALRAAMVRMGVRVGSGGPPVVALDTDDALPPGVDVCWISGDIVLLAPPGVPAHDVAARRRGATAHRDTDPLMRPLPAGRTVTSAMSVPPAGLELAAVTVAAELLRLDRPAYEAVMVDLHGLTVTRRPVLPVPPSPR